LLGFEQVHEMRLRGNSPEKEVALMPLMHFVHLIGLGGSWRVQGPGLGRRLLAPALRGGMVLFLLIQAGCTLVTFSPVNDCTPVSVPHLTAPLDAGRLLFFGQRAEVPSGSPARLTALDAATGARRWQQEVGPTPSRGEPTVYHQAVYVVERQTPSTADLFAYRTSDGALLWHTDSSSPGYNVFWDPERAPLIADGLIYTTLTSSPDGLRVAAFHASTGAPAWNVSSYSFPIEGLSGIEHLEPLAAASGLLFVSALVTTQAGEETHTVALRAEDGKPLWETHLTGSFPLAAAGILYLHNGQGLYALRASDGTLLWTLPWTKTLLSEDFTRPSLSSAGQRLYITVYDNTEEGKGRDLLYALDTRDGRVLWKADAGFSARGIPVEANGIVYASGDHSLYALRASDGHQLWRLQTNANVEFGTPLVLDQVVFVQAYFHFRAYGTACPDGYRLYQGVLAANAATGALYWRFANDSNAGDPVGDVQTA
jgi:outer membrane protein assembly factor BamB